MIVIGIDHTRASSLEIARASRHATDAAEAALTAPSVDGVVMLTTCGRVEAYVDGSRFHEARDRVVDALGCDPGLVRTARGEAAVAHLFAVTSGLRSASVGEPEITGQVRRALAAARVSATVTTALGIAFEQAIATARAVRPVLGGPGRSLADVALDGVDLTDVPAVVLGSGAFAASAVPALRARGASRVVAHSPSGRRMVEADAMLDRDALLATLATAGAVVAASGRGRILAADELERAITSRASDLAVIDLTGGIDLDPSVARLPHVAYRDLDGLADGTDDARIAAAEHESATRARATWSRIVGAELDDTIVALRALVERAAHAARTGDPATDAALRRATRTLLHEPTMRARQAAEEGRLHDVRQALRTLYGDALDDVLGDAFGTVLDRAGGAGA